MNINPDSATMPAKQRITWIDFSRYLAILFVLETHSGMHLLQRSNLWAGAAVFLFFFLAGYFNRKSGLPLLKRCVILFICSIFWSFIKACIIRHGLHFSLHEFVFEHNKFRNTMWFLDYLVIWMILSPLFRAIPIAAIRWLIPAALILYYGIHDIFALVDKPHISYFASAGLFYLGMNMQGTSLTAIMPKTGVQTAKKWLILSVVLTLVLLTLTGAMQWRRDISEHGVCMLAIAYLYLLISNFAGQVLPNFTAKVARMGAATIFIYVCHSAIFHVWTGGYIALFHYSPPVYITMILALVILIGGPWFYYKANGKNKLLDILLFAK